MMIADVDDALISAGADDAEARDAAKAIADYKGESAEIPGKLALLRWMGRPQSAVTLTAAWKAFS